MREASRPREQGHEDQQDHFHPLRNGQQHLLENAVLRDLDPRPGQSLQSTIEAEAVPADFPVLAVDAVLVTAVSEHECRDGRRRVPTVAVEVARVVPERDSDVDE